MRLFKKAECLWIIFCFLMLICPDIYAKGKTMTSNKIIELSSPTVKGSVSVEEAILKRRSIRSFSSKELSLNQISQILWSAQGITGKKSGFAFRSAPSAGALYPMEVYIAKTDGIFHYLPQGHKLEMISTKDVRKELARASWEQDFIYQAPVDMVLCAVYSRITSKYGERGIRYAHIEAGHIAENIHLQAVSLGLGSVPVGAFDDDEVQKALSLPSDCEPLYVIPVGYPVTPSIRN